MTALQADKVPITILAGFLGAGKTTLLNRILSGEPGVRVAVLVNDFGAIDIDARLITRVEGETVSLANGCICCTIRDDLAAAIAGLLDAAEPPQHILTETSGVSEPASVAMAVAMAPRLATRAGVDAIVTVVDAEQVLELDGSQAALAADQVAAADIVVVNKNDLVDGARRRAVHDWVRSVTPQARIVDAVQGDVPLPVLLGAQLAPERAFTARAAHAHAHHDRVFETWSWRCEEPLAFQAVYEALRTLPAEIYRAKGILALAEVPERRVVAQVVGRRVTLARGAPWEGERPQSALVVIGAAGGVDAGELGRRFAACRAGVAQVPESRMADAVVEVLRRP